jgi:hypothetical protein
MGGDLRSFYFRSFDFVCLFCFCFVFVVFFMTSVLLLVWGMFTNVMLEVFFPFGMVFLATLGIMWTMCHFNSGVGKTLLSISCHFLLCVCVF